MPPDEHDLELANALERRLDRDDERERFDRTVQRVNRKPSYSRFRTLAALWEHIGNEQTMKDKHSTDAALTRAA